jgi:transposase
MDETTVSLHPPLRRCWKKRGQRKSIPAPGTPEYVHIFGAYNWRNSEVAWRIDRKKNSEAFVAFLEQLTLTDYPRQRLILVLDNASYHKSKTVRAALSALEDRVLVFWLPKYSPFLNPIERFWLHLKNLVVANRLHHSLADLLTALEQTLANQNLPHHPNRLVFADEFRLLA